MPLATEQDLDYIFNRLADAKEVVYDSETSGLDFKRNHIVGHGLAFSENPIDAWYMPVRHLGNNNLFGNAGPTDKHGWNGKIEPWEAGLIKLLDRQDLTSIYHNAAFDLKMLVKCGLQLTAKYQDTAINAPLLNELQGKFSLEHCCHLAGVQAKKSSLIEAHIKSKFPEIKDKPMAHFWRLEGDDPVAVAYACGDNTSTFQLRNWQQKKLEQEELLRVWKIECRLIPVLVRMTVKGIKVDEEYLHKLYAYVNNRIEILQGEFPEGFNSKSPLDMREYCETNNITDWPTTPAGNPSFSESWLEKSPAGLKVVQLRKLLTLNSMFIEPLINTHLFNGRVHPNFNQLRNDEYGTVTGRPSTSDPNFGAIPKRDKVQGPLFRAVFIPDEDMECAEFDYKQAEPRLLAYYSRAKVLLNDYRTNPNADAHQAVANAFGGSRTDGKSANMTIINSGGRNVLVAKYHVPEDKVDDLLTNYFKAMPEVRQLQKRAAAKFKMRGYVRTLLGRKCRLVRHDKSYTAVNRLLQSGNADIMKLKLVEIDDYLAAEGRPLDLLNTVYDSITFQYLLENKKHYLECQRIAQSFGEADLIQLDLPMLIDTSEGENWAIVSYGEEVREQINEVRNFNADSYRKKSIYESLAT